MTDLVLHAGLPQAGGDLLRETVFPLLSERFFVGAGRGEAHNELMRGLNRLYHGRGLDAETLVAGEAFDTILAGAEGRDLVVSGENLTVRASGVWLEGYQNAADFAATTARLAHALRERGIALRLLLTARRQDDWLAARYAASSKRAEIFSPEHFAEFLASPLLEEIAALSVLDYDRLHARLAATCPGMPFKIASHASLEKDPRGWLRGICAFLKAGPETVARVLDAAPTRAEIADRAGGPSWPLAGGGEARLDEARRARVLGLFAASNAAHARRTGQDVTADVPPPPAPSPAARPRRTGAQRAVIVPSIGERPWIGDVTDLAGRYAARVGAELIVEREAPSLSDLPLPELADRPGRRHKRLYACKSFFAWKHLTAGFEQVLVIDDSCCIDTQAPDIFNRVPEGHVGYTKTGQGDARKSFRDIARFTAANGLPEIDYDVDLYMNSGVMVYDRAAIPALAPEAIAAARDLLFSAFPHQSLSYFLLRKAGLPMRAVDKKFNTVPAVGLEKEVRREMTDIRPHLSSSVYIYHVTGMYHHRDRLIPQICDAIRGRAGEAAS